MKIKIFTLFIFTLTLLSTSSCIRDEAQSVECDILSVSPTWVKQHKSFLLGNPRIKQTNAAEVIFLIAKDTTALQQLNPQFQVSPGATLYYRQPDTRKLLPYDSAARYDFTRPQVYSVKSEDGQFVKDYTVLFTLPLPIDSCNFSKFTYDNTATKNFMVPLQQQEDGSLSSNIWTTGNSGFELVPLQKTAEDYPTAFLLDPSTQHLAACMTTRSCGFFGAMAGKPIAAGNLFIGSFDRSTAMANPLGATRFGLQVATGFPTTLTLQYRYQPAEKVTDKNNTHLQNVRDSADVYAILYEVDPNHFVPLNGADVLTSDRIVRIARFPYLPPTQEWRRVSIPFQTLPGKTYSRERLLRKEYAYTIVATSSKQGAYFIGAVGSQLWVNLIKTTWN